MVAGGWCLGETSSPGVPWPSGKCSSRDMAQAVMPAWCKSPVQDRQPPPCGTDAPARTCRSDVRGVSVQRAASVQNPLPGQDPFFHAGVGALGAGSRLGLETSPVSNGGEDLAPGILAQAQRLPWLLLIGLHPSATCDMVIFVEIRARTLTYFVNQSLFRAAGVGVCLLCRARRDKGDWRSRAGLWLGMESC